jgi:hypothetical protein
MKSGLRPQVTSISAGVYCSSPGGTVALACDYLFDGKIRAAQIPVARVYRHHSGLRGTGCAWREPSLGSVLGVWRREGNSPLRIASTAMAQSPGSLFLIATIIPGDFVVAWWCSLLLMERNTHAGDHPGYIYEES